MCGLKYSKCVSFCLMVPVLKLCWSLKDRLKAVHRGRDHQLTGEERLITHQIKMR